MGYSVTDTREIAALTPAGTERKVYRVWILTDNGASGSVDVPADKWNDTDLPGILAEKASQLDLAFSLGG